MSWFRRKPRLKEPSKLVPHRSSPIAESMLDEAKAKGPTQKEKKPKAK